MTESAFEKLSRAEPAIVRASGAERAPHTTPAETAGKLVAGYLAFLDRVAGWSPPRASRCLDLGAGAGHIAAAFNTAGLRMTASEHTDEGVALIKESCPGLPAEKKSVADFREPESYDLIFSREIYPFTRINAWEEQRRAVSNIIDSLKPGGAFLLVGSDVCAPDCLDYDRLIAELRRDPRLARVTDKHLEVHFKHFAPLIRGPITYAALSAALSPVVFLKHKLKGFARIYLVAFVKNWPSMGGEAGPSTQSLRS